MRRSEPPMIFMSSLKKLPAEREQDFPNLWHHGYSMVIHGLWYSWYSPIYWEVQSSNKSSTHIGFANWLNDPIVRLTQLIIPYYYPQDGSWYFLLSHHYPIITAFNDSTCYPIIFAKAHVLHFCKNICLQNWVISGVNVGKYSSTMEHLGRTDIRSDPATGTLRQCFLYHRFSPRGSQSCRSWKHFHICCMSGCFKLYTGCFPFTIYPNHLPKKYVNQRNNRPQSVLDPTPKTPWWNVDECGETGHILMTMGRLKLSGAEFSRRKQDIKERHTVDSIVI